MNDAPDALAAHARRKVRAVARESGPHAEQLFSEAARGRRDWTPAEWAVVLQGLDGCHQAVGEWRGQGEWLK